MRKLWVALVLAVSVALAVLTPLTAHAQDATGPCVQLKPGLNPVVIPVTVDGVKTRVHILENTPGIIVGGANFLYHVVWAEGVLPNGAVVTLVDDPRRANQHVVGSDTCPTLEPPPPPPAG